MSATKVQLFSLAATYLKGKKHNEQDFTEKWWL